MSEIKNGLSEDGNTFTFVMNVEAYDEITEMDLTRAQKRVCRPYTGEYIKMPKGSGKSTACFMGAVKRFSINEKGQRVAVGIFCKDIQVYKDMVAEEIDGFFEDWDYDELEERSFRLEHKVLDRTLIVSIIEDGKLADRWMCLGKPEEMMFEYNDIYFDDYTPDEIGDVFGRNFNLDNFVKNKWVVVYTDVFND